jgi:hypothetical protein|tara:strand:- start:7340 stop:8116 length:777 start_codon:yes stop_codon:yes gene_type:complete
MPLKLHGKEYMTVAERINLLLSQGEVTRFYSLNTDIVEMNDAYCVIKATLTFKGTETDLHFTGHAMEEKGNKGVNKTSHVENCETSAIGRALAAAGFHGSEYASADELVEALNKQSDNFATPSKVINPSQSNPESSKGSVESSASGFKGGYYDFLQRCSSEKVRVGEAQYRSTLKQFSLEKANQIDKNDTGVQARVIEEFTRLKEVTHDLIFGLEVSYLCSKSDKANKLVDDLDVGLDSIKTLDAKRDLLDKLIIATT